MKSKEEIQRTWEAAWFNPLAESESLTFETIANIKAELRKEVYWIVTLPAGLDLFGQLDIRINKIQNLMNANDGSAASFDVYYSYRKQFFEWAIV